MALRISLLIESDAVTTIPVSTTPGHVFLSDVSVKSVLLLSMMKSTFSGQPGLTTTSWRQDIWALRDLKPHTKRRTITHKKKNLCHTWTYDMHQIVLNSSTRLLLLFTSGSSNSNIVSWVFRDFLWDTLSFSVWSNSVCVCVGWERETKKPKI